jgi:hypothetical protein
MGGGTNINACLVVRPPLDDFQNWPSFWTEPVPGMLHHKKGEEAANTNTLMPRMMAAVIKVEHEMRLVMDMEHKLRPGRVRMGNGWKINLNLRHALMMMMMMVSA